MENGILNPQAQLILGLRSGDENSFAILYGSYSAALFGIINRIVDDQKEAENLLQDCFIKIWQNISRYDHEKGKLATWLFNIARNTAIDFKRSKYFNQLQKNQNVENLVRDDIVHAVTVPVIDTLGLRQVVARLTPVCREVIEWMYFEGYTQQEIAEDKGIPLGTVKSRTRLALKELRAYYN
ncbi:MAG: sigma-70 family RNA polymerase sigma factor [Saprospiraceae bacterium]